MSYKGFKSAFGLCIW